MAINVSNRKVKMARCIVSPAISPKPQLAHVFSQMKAEAELTTIGIYVKTYDGREHVIPYTNIEYFELEPTVEEKSKKQ